MHSAICAMSNFVEQRSAIKFYLRNDISAAETLRMIQKAFGDETMSQKNVYKWYRDFKENVSMICNASDSSDAPEMVHGNRRLTIRELVVMVGISFGSVRTILKDNLGLKRVKSRLGPKGQQLLDFAPQ